MKATRNTHSGFVAGALLTVLLAIGAVAAVVTVAVLATNGWAAGWPLWAAVVVGLTVVTAHVMLRAREDEAWNKAAWRQLELLSPELAGELEEAAILRVALADSLSLFRCDAVEVVLDPRGEGRGLVARLSKQANDQIHVRPLTVAEPIAAHVSASEPASVTGEIVVTLHGSGHVIGRLRVMGGSPRGARTRRHLAGAFAHLLGSSLGTERMYEAQRRLAEHTYNQALQDDLTSLGNRSLLTRRGNQHLAVSTAQRRRAALLLIDLDDFKRVNDTLGHAAGDRVLAEVGLRLHAAVREGDLAVRIGGDEFAVLTGELHVPEDAERVAERLMERLAAPIRVDDVQLTVTASVGIAVQGDDGGSIDELLNAADAAMYDAKAAGHGQWRRYAAGIAGGPDRRERLVEDLRRGLPEEQVVVHYQPQVDPHSLQVTGFEALVRWQHPTLGLLQPDEFVPLAERLGLMSTLTISVLDRALTDLDRLREGAPSASVSVNVSARNLLGEGLVGDVERALTRHGTLAADLTLEVSEPATGPSAAVTVALAGLEALGCQVSIHEFGTGQSSLIALSHHPAIREIKIDPSLAAAVLVDHSAQRLVHAMVNTAHGLEVRVVAEGVESAEIGAALRDLGCDRLQGFHIHEPAPVDQILAWLRGGAMAPPASGDAVSGALPVTEEAIRGR
jgi:diguanylate cyclase (GGDEF)-like protein